MPTKEELEELIALPNQWVINYNGVSGLNGRVFTGTNGNTLFMPAAGFFYGSTTQQVGSGCGLWSSIIIGDPYTALYLYFTSDYIYISNGNNRGDRGFSVRCVSTD